MIDTESNFSYKNFFKNYGFFIAIIVVIFGILFYSIFLSRKPWQKYLKTQVETVLNEKQPDVWTVGDFKRIENPFALNAACYEAKVIQTNESYYAIILRIQTLYGPVAAVFTVDKYVNVEFIGYSSLHGRVENQLLIFQSDKRLDYWKKKIPEILKLKGAADEK